MNEQFIMNLLSLWLISVAADVITPPQHHLNTDTWRHLAGCQVLYLENDTVVAYLLELLFCKSVCTIISVSPKNGSPLQALATWQYDRSVITTPNTQTGSTPRSCGSILWHYIVRIWRIDILLQTTSTIKTHIGLSLTFLGGASVTIWGGRRWNGTTTLGRCQLVHGLQHLFGQGALSLACGSFPRN